MTEVLAAGTAKFAVVPVDILLRQFISHYLRQCGYLGAKGSALGGGRCRSLRGTWGPKNSVTTWIANTSLSLTFLRLSLFSFLSLLSCFNHSLPFFLFSSSSHTISPHFLSYVLLPLALFPSSSMFLVCDALSFLGGEGWRREEEKWKKKSPNWCFVFVLVNSNMVRPLKRPAISASPISGAR